MFTPLAAVLVLLAGLLAPRFFSTAHAQPFLWLGGLVVLGVPIVWSSVKGMFEGRFATDLVASLSIVTAAVLQQPVAGLVIVLMQSGGEALERAAARRASQAVADLEAQAPRVAHRIQAQGGIEDIGVDQIHVGDRLLVRPGEMVPCNSVVSSGTSSVDTSRITGEPMPRTLGPGDAVASGTVNLDRPLTVDATARADASLYHQIVELVRSAQASKAPIQRLADRVAVWFTPVTIAACLLVYLVSRDPTRVLAVLVVATPCPLILAAPVAMLAGVNRAARHQIIVRHGTALEQLAAINLVFFDKTGTVTIGRPQVAAVVPMPPFSVTDLLRLAGAVENGSGHLLARSTVDAAIAATGALPHATEVIESAGRGVTGVVEGRRVTIGALTLLNEWEPAAAAAFLGGQGASELRAYVAIDRVAAGTIVYADAIRPTAKAMMRGLWSLGIHRSVLLSGDRTVNARAAAAKLQIPEAVGDLLPQDKVGYVARMAKAGHRVMMVGDGANDAPALSAASVGLAIAATGGGISAEAADVVLLSDDLTRIPEAIAIARRTMRIARQSIGVGLGLSAVAMMLAASGWIAPTIGALVQEGIDVAVILNALRVLTSGPLEVALHRAFKAAD